MAKLRMTYKNLKALRKSREYQALIVDLVSVGVVPKATAEGLLGYNIPANLITDDENSGTDNPIDDGGGSGGGSVDVDITVPSVTVTLLYWNDEDWFTYEYTPTSTDFETESEAMVTAARTVFDLSEEYVNAVKAVQLNNEYVEGETQLAEKYVVIDPQPTTLTDSALILCCFFDK